MNNLENVDLEYLKHSEEYREKLCKSLYSSEKLRHSIANYIEKNGNKYEVAEVFQEAIVRFFRNAIQKDFTISVPVENYVFGTAKFVYLSYLKSIKDVKIEYPIGNILC